MNSTDANSAGENTLSNTIEHKPENRVVVEQRVDGTSKIIVELLLHKGTLTARDVIEIATRIENWICTKQCPCCSCAFDRSNGPCY